jgi:hypothetical protein
VTSFKLFFENALGLIETVTFKDLGPVSAKVDSGNGAYNVLHGTDIKSDWRGALGQWVKFKTVDDKILSKRVKEYIDINIGSGNVEKRPVVLFDIMLGGKSYPNTPFSIADRSSNEQKILLGKDFIEKLGGLIDVTKQNNVS